MRAADMSGIFFRSCSSSLAITWQRLGYISDPIFCTFTFVAGCNKHDITALAEIDVERYVLFAYLLWSRIQGRHGIQRRLTKTRRVYAGHSIR